jgi:hypothetical protein
MWEIPDDYQRKQKRRCFIEHFPSSQVVEVCEHQQVRSVLFWLCLPSRNRNGICLPLRGSSKGTMLDLQPGTYLFIILLEIATLQI